MKKEKLRGRAAVKTIGKASNKNGKKVFLLALPMIVVVFVFHYLPLWGWSFAFFQYKPGKNLLDCVYVGWDNFTALFGNVVMRRNLFRVLRNTFGIHILGYLFTPLPLLVAVFLSEMQGRRFRKFVQSVTTLPNFVGWVIIYSLVNSFFSTGGLVNTVLMDLGWISEPTNLMTSSNHVWIRMVLLQQWKSLGWSAIVYFASIAGIDQEMYEAAMVDGASRTQRIRYISIPMLIPTYFVLLIMSIGNFLNTGVDQFLAFGNALNKEYIEVLDLYVYKLGIGSGQISFSVAVGIMKSVVALVLFGMANTASKKIRGTSVF
ncbi:ABC transporter permease subunit [Acetatifactor muris]|uniref:Putative multiple-sugar transport system permease YteP n=1 Tax=Acetatifactor muris TaxID=879566 RepID=A0A2K4ZA53_9FIRM|nr:ABC transporter permease subunit [Acetatifactor muris]MCI8800264.1 sugar ABC transporter permease [Lachnospiraceae bacterium]MCR2047441.1 ABC transporter permease subunit [Acetatifactor muris]SOY27335.1 putative multiple-sugar transport system permease YteP [Acetatifactor muris]